MRKDIDFLFSFVDLTKWKTRIWVNKKKRQERRRKNVCYIINKSRWSHACMAMNCVVAADQRFISSRPSQKFG